MSQTPSLSDVSPGGGVDTVARIAAQHYHATWQQPFVVLLGCAVDDAAWVDAPVVVAEAFLTAATPLANLDSPAVWFGPDAAWVITTGKSSHQLHVHDAATGAPVATVGRAGRGPRAFDRPNGIAVAGDLVLVVAGLMAVFGRFLQVRSVAA